jgi:hypothetical protein
MPSRTSLPSIGALLETKQACSGVDETEPILVKLGQFRLVIRVEPAAASGGRFIGESFNQSAPYPASLAIRIDHRVKNKCVLSPVPAGVNEPDQSGTVERADPTQSVPL